VAGIGDAIEGVLTLLNMLGGLVRKAVRGNRTGVFREWRYRDNTWLGIAVILGAVVLVFCIWFFFLI
jgi:hypothetical protein